MRARLFFSSTVVALALFACAHEEHRGPAHPSASTGSSPGTPPVPAQYLVADPTGFSRMASLVVPLADGSVGIVVDRARIVTGQGDARVAVDLPDQSITGAEKVPGRFGGGFLFWTTDSVLYRSDTFDGPLKPVVKVPDSVQSISFAPAFVLVRTNNGERWALSLPSGKRVAMAPLGMADEVALDDGRALAYTDQGVVFTSTDGGAHWTDMTTSVRSSPQKVARVEEDLWLFEASGSAQRLEVDGHLAFFDHPPVEKAVEVRPRDARWRGNDAPLREAFRGGAAIDEGTALVVSEGDLVRLDVRTGDVLSIVAGKLPPDSRCDAVPTSNDVLFTCVSRASGSASFAPSAFVVSHTLTDEAPLIEHTFAGAAPFYASDDGGLAYGGPCASAAAVLSPAFPTVGVPPRPSSACVRQPSGTWQEVDVAGASADGGVSTAIVSRWVPRADGRAVALVTDPTPGIFDPQTNRLIELGPDARDALGEGISKVGRDGKRYAYFNGTTALIDWSWSFTAANLLRGWNRQGGIVELSDDGKITRSPFTFESVAAGPYAIGRSPQGRLYQSTDHGSTWDEIATPPSGGTALELRSCSSAGCDLGGF